MSLHRPDHFHERRPCHDAVGIEDDHIPVGAAPPPAKIGDISAFAFQIDSPSAVKDAIKGVEGAAYLEAISSSTHLSGSPESLRNKKWKW
jgi:hypothetical protein